MIGDYVCSVCGARESVVGNRVKVYKVGDTFFCENHMPVSHENLDNRAAMIPVNEASQDQKITSLTENIILLKKGQDEQTALLKSIKGSLTFFVVLVSIGLVLAVINSCTTALGFGY